MKKRRKTMAKDFEFLKKQMNTMVSLEKVLKEMLKIVDYNIADEEAHYEEWYAENYGQNEDNPFQNNPPSEMPTSEIDSGHIYSSLRIVQDFLNGMR
jgi:hypothetical protein